ncbi:MAG: hypothetical protein N4A74_26780 [Carboxylicivirga sp.]|jgi:hypothetical protein|nr:hypothetical protein [Carboxylicivirga sp.]
MSKKNELKDQVRLVIKFIEEKYQEDEMKGVLGLIFKRYNNALKLIDNNMANKDNLNIQGGIRAYMDSYSDYDNPLLNKMHKAEKLVEELFL